MTDDRGVSNGTETPDLTAVADHQARIAALLTTTPVESRPVAECLGLAL